MRRNDLRFLIVAAFLCGGLFISSVRLEAFYKKDRVLINDSSSTNLRTEDLHPFTHIAYLPAGADVRTIRFENVKAVKIPVKISYTMDADYCTALAFREPGGSMYCPRKEARSLTTAYQVTYSFRGRPLASDEYGQEYFTFVVNFRPDELPPSVRQAVSAGRLKRVEAAECFRVAIWREALQRVVIDEARSRFCEMVVRDGNWFQSDPNCQVQLNYKTVAVPSDQIAVRIDPVPPR